MSVIKMYGYEAAQQTEYQAKKWATKEEMQALSSGDEQRDVILAHGATVAFYEGDKHWEMSVSNNVFVFGGTGSGKTASFVLPNLLNHHECCYVVTDTKGELLRRTGKGFEEDGYEVTVLDTVNPERSAGYDPLRYVMDVEDIPTTVAAIMEGVDPDGRSFRNDPFWDNASDLLLRAIIGILFLLECLAGTFAPGGDPTAPRRYLKMNNVFKLAALIKVTGDGEGRFPLDYLVGQVESKEFLGRHESANADLYGVEQYRDFRGAAEVDATSLTNMKQAVVWLKACNEYRASVGLGELKVTYAMMATAIADANFSDTKVAHAQQFNVGENVAWNYGSNPFKQWVDQEKAIFDAAAASLGASGLTGKAAYDFYTAHSSQIDNYAALHGGPNPSVGHYINVINPDYTVTGMGVCTRGTLYGSTQAQTFVYSGQWYKPYNLNPMTVAEYEAALNAWCDSLANPEQGVDAARKELAVAQGVADDAGSKVSAAS